MSSQKQVKRLSKHEYLMNIAKAAAIRSTCPDLRVACVIATRDGHVLSIGYNGSVHGSEHCRVKNGKCLDNGSMHAVIHAEINALCHATKYGIPLANSVAFITKQPCLKCEMALKQAGIKRVIVYNG